MNETSILTWIVAIVSMVTITTLLVKSTSYAIETETMRGAVCCYSNNESLKAEFCGIEDCPALNCSRPYGSKCIEYTLDG